MNVPTYARIEYERRFLVAPDSGWRAGLKPYTKPLVDRYLSCGRLRLRRLEDSDTGRVAFKLTKKYESDSMFARPVVSTWLSELEFESLCQLDGFGLSKTRHYHEWNGVVFSIDVFEGELRGLILCETEEAGSIDELRAVRFPDYARWEVTEDEFFTGGRLCRSSRDELNLEIKRVMNR